MIKLRKTAGVLAVSLIFLLVAGCGESQRDIKIRERNDRVIQSCIDAGGVPIQSWFNNEVLGDCKFNLSSGN